MVMEIFRGCTDFVEPLSLDEAFLDVTDCRQHKGSATLIAQDIRRQIHQDNRPDRLRRYLLQ